MLISLPLMQLQLANSIFRGMQHRLRPSELRKLILKDDDFSYCMTMGFIGCLCKSVSKSVAHQLGKRKNGWYYFIFTELVGKLN